MGAHRKDNCLCWQLESHYPASKYPLASTTTLHISDNATHNTPSRGRARLSYHRGLPPSRWVSQSVKVAIKPAHVGTCDASTLHNGRRKAMLLEGGGRGEGNEGWLC